MPIDREDAAHFFHAAEMAWRGQYGTYPLIEAWDFAARRFFRITTDQDLRTHLLQYPTSQAQRECPN